MLEIISNLRNNNLRKIPGYDPSRIEHLRKVLRSVIRDSSKLVYDKHYCSMTGDIQYVMFHSQRRVKSPALRQQITYSVYLDRFHHTIPNSLMGFISRHILFLCDRATKLTAKV